MGGMNAGIKPNVTDLRDKGYNFVTISFIIVLVLSSRGALYL
jgi:hypothetical protein